MRIRIHISTNIVILENMRLINIEHGVEVYECFECGCRVEKADPGTCEKCGGELLHLGRSRDL